MSDEDKTLLFAGGLETLRQVKPECLAGITQDNLDRFMQLVFDEGWYPGQAQEIMREQEVIREQRPRRGRG